MMSFVVAWQRPSRSSPPSPSCRDTDRMPCASPSRRPRPICPMPRLESSQQSCIRGRMQASGIEAGEG